MGNTSEVVERKDAGRQTGDECGQPNPGEIEHYFPPPTATGPVAHEPLTVFIDGDEGHHSSEGHLETGTEEAFRRDQQDCRGSPRDQAERNRRSIQQNGEKNQTNHQKSALRRDSCARKQQITERPASATAAAHFLIGLAQRQQFAHRKKSAQPKEQSRGDEAHMQSGNGQQMAKPESRIASTSSLGMALRSPVLSAAATAPDVPGMAVRIRSASC